MIISYDNNFIFFKPLKTAGTSIEAALSIFCGEKDMLTGSIVLEEILDKRFNLSPRNNFQKEKILTGAEALNYLKANGREDLYYNSGYKKFKIVDKPVYYEHQSPQDFDFESYNSDIVKVSMVRNPYDLMVSYFWWSYYYTEDAVSYNKDKINKIKLAKENVRCKPKISDSLRDLKNKFESWCNAPAYAEHTLQPCSGEKTIAEWFSSISNQFFNNRKIDYYIKFENLKEDYSQFCKIIGKQPNALPKFKSSIRKLPIHYTEYYNLNSERYIKSLFQETIHEFEYKFNLR